MLVLNAGVERAVGVEPRDAVAGHPLTAVNESNDHDLPFGPGGHRPHIAAEASAEVGAERRIEAPSVLGSVLCRRTHCHQAGHDIAAATQTPIAAAPPEDGCASTADSAAGTHG